MQTKIPLTADLLRQRYTQDGLTLQQIADECGYSLKVVWSRMCRFGIARRPGCARWKGGVLVDKAGYVLLYRPDHPQANHAGYVREHRLVMEKKLGRSLLRSEVVHHKDDNPANNHPDNLELFENNTAHLCSTLTGKCPQWTEDGRRRIAAGVDKIRLKHLPPVEDIVEMYKTMTSDEIADKLGCSQRPILDRLKSAGVPVLDRKARCETRWPPREHMLMLLNAEPVVAVAKRLGRSIQGVYLWMKVNGIPTKREARIRSMHGER